MGKQCIKKNYSEKQYSKLVNLFNAEVNNYLSADILPNFIKIEALLEKNKYKSRFNNVLQKFYAYLVEFNAENGIALKPEFNHMTISGKPAREYIKLLKKVDYLKQCSFTKKPLTQASVLNAMGKAFQHINTQTLQKSIITPTIQRVHAVAESAILVSGHAVSRSLYTVENTLTSAFKSPSFTTKRVLISLAYWLAGQPVAAMHLGRNKLIRHKRTERERGLENKNQIPTELIKFREALEAGNNNLSDFLPDFKKFNIHTRFENGNTLIHYAIMSRNWKGIWFLLRYGGALLDNPNDSGLTARELAKSFGLNLIQLESYESDAKSARLTTNSAGVTRSLLAFVPTGITTTLPLISPITSQKPISETVNSETESNAHSFSSVGIIASSTTLGVVALGAMAGSVYYLKRRFHTLESEVRLQSTHLGLDSVDDIEAFLPPPPASFLLSANRPLVAHPCELESIRKPLLISSASSVSGDSGRSSNTEASINLDSQDIFQFRVQLIQARIVELEDTLKPLENVKAYPRMFGNALKNIKTNLAEALVQNNSSAFKSILSDLISILPDDAKSGIYQEGEEPANLNYMRYFLDNIDTDKNKKYPVKNFTKLISDLKEKVDLLLSYLIKLNEEWDNVCDVDFLANCSASSVPENVSHQITSGYLLISKTTLNLLRRNFLKLEMLDLYLGNSIDSSEIFVLLSSLSISLFNKKLDEIGGIIFKEADFKNPDEKIDITSIVPIMRTAISNLNGLQNKVIRHVVYSQTRCDFVAVIQNTVELCEGRIKFYSSILQKLQNERKGRKEGIETCLKNIELLQIGKPMSSQEVSWIKGEEPPTQPKPHYLGSSNRYRFHKQESVPVHSSEGAESSSYSSFEIA